VAEAMDGSMGTSESDLIRWGVWELAWPSGKGMDGLVACAIPPGVELCAPGCWYGGR
jgi:hypothetical protein